MSFAEQPAEMLDLLLNNTAVIPLPQRMRLRAVCRRWLPVLEDGLAREATLVIRHQEVLSPGPTPDHLVIERDILTDEFIRTLGRLFPLATQLTLSFGESPSASVCWATVPSLLTQLGANLTCVKLYGCLEQAVAEPLSRALTNISNLTWLTLFDYTLNAHLLPLLGPVLLRLEALECPQAWDDEFGPLLSSSLSPRCTHLQMDADIFATFEGAFLTQLSTRLMHLSLWMSDNGTVWQSLLPMHRLTSLELDFHSDQVTHLDVVLFRRLVPFSRLTDLKLFGLVYQIPLDLPVEMEATLSTVQRLTLRVDFEDEYDDFVNYRHFFRWLAVWFPALTRLTLIVDEETFPDIQARLGQVQFTVETVDRFTLIHCFSSWW